MTVLALLDDNRRQVRTLEGGAVRVVAVPKDFTGTAITEANLVTLTVTLYDQRTGRVINSRSAQSVKDANGGTVVTNGTLTLILLAADNPIVSDTTPPGGVERHVLRLAWTYSDGSNTIPGVGEWLIEVERKAVVT
jgi:hypothetical protein